MRVLLLWMEKVALLLLHKRWPLCGFTIGQLRQSKCQCCVFLCHNISDRVRQTKNRTLVSRLMCEPEIPSVLQALPTQAVLRGRWPLRFRPWSV